MSVILNEVKDLARSSARFSGELYHSFSSSSSIGNCEILARGRQWNPRGGPREILRLAQRSLRMTQKTTTRSGMNLGLKRFDG